MTIPSANPHGREIEIGSVSPTQSVHATAEWRVTTIRAIAIASVLLALSSLAKAAWDQDWTFDETFHLEYARGIATDTMPSRADINGSKTPAMLPNVFVQNLVAKMAGGDNPRRQMFVARLTTALYFVGLLFAVFFFTKKFSNSLAGWIAVLLCALDQSIVAHSGLTTVDVPFALASLLALWTMLIFARDANWKTALLLGVGFGFALSVKFTGLYLAPAFLSLVLWRPGESWIGRREVFRRIGWLGIAALVTCLFISATYFFRDFGMPLSAAQFQTFPFRALSKYLGWMRLPLPGAYLPGVDMVVSQERANFNVVILDRWYDRGVWYYFFVLWLLKTPLAVVLGTGAVAWLGWRSGAFRQRGMYLLYLQWILYFFYFSFVFHAQLGYRYCLMLLPLAYLFIAVGGKDWWNKPKGTYAVLAVALISFVEIIPYWGHPIAFSNSFVLPKRNAFHFIADSNLYWNEYEFKIPELVRQRNIAGRINPLHLLPGKLVFDADTLSGVRWNFEQHQWIRENLSPSDHIRHVLFVYDVSNADFDRFLEEKRRFTPSDYTADCAGPFQSAPFVEIEGPGRNFICVDAREKSDVSVSAVSGSALIGHVAKKDRCYPEYVKQTQEAWYRLEPGRHLFCVMDDKGFRGQWNRHAGRITFRQ